MNDIFTQVVKLLVESRQVNLQEVFIDWTKIEANANQSTFVWGKALPAYISKMLALLKELCEYAEKIAHIEKDDTTPTDFEPTDPEKVKASKEKINETLKTNTHEMDKKVKAKVNYAKNHFRDAIEKYNEQEKILGERNSFRKTDHDATFMRIKEEHMGKGQCTNQFRKSIKF